MCLNIVKMSIYCQFTVNLLSIDTFENIAMPPLLTFLDHFPFPILILKVDSRFESR